MVADLFLRTYPGDYAWLPFLFRSLARHARGWRRLVVVTPTGNLYPLVGVDPRLPIVYCNCSHYTDDYVGQQITKLRAEEYTDADEICYLDSDLVLLKALTPDTLRAPSGKLILETREWSESGQALAAWFNVTKTLLGEVEPPFETMARHPFQYPTAFVTRVWDSVRRVMLFPNQKISEFNLLGNYAYLYEPDLFEFRNVGAIGDSIASPREGDIVRQFWSRGGITAEVAAELMGLGYLGIP